jgi:hypothetical protein
MSPARWPLLIPSRDFRADRVSGTNTLWSPQPPTQIPLLGDSNRLISLVALAWPGCSSTETVGLRLGLAR